MVDFETSSSKSEVSKSSSWKITSFSKTMALQREPFLTMFYTINLSALLVIKKGCMLIIILSNYQQCTLPLKCKETAVGDTRWQTQHKSTLLLCASSQKFAVLIINEQNRTCCVCCHLTSLTSLFRCHIASITIVRWVVRTVQ